MKLLSTGDAKLFLMTVSKHDHYVYHRESRINFRSSSISGASNKAAFLQPKGFRSTFFSNTNTTRQGKKKYSHIQDIIYSSVFIAICLELIHWKAAVGLCLVIREKPHFKITFIKRNKEHTSLGPQQFMPKLSC